MSLLSTTYIVRTLILSLHDGKEIHISCPCTPFFSYEFMIMNDRIEWNYADWRGGMPNRLFSFLLYDFISYLLQNPGQDQRDICIQTNQERRAFV
jgi:hypothetical protein